MTRLALPGPEAQALQQAAAAEARLQMLRFETAKSIYGHLLAVDYRAAQARAIEQADPFGTKSEGSDDDDEADDELHFQLDLGCSARISVKAADALLMTLGIIKPPPQPKVNDGPR